MALLCLHVVAAEIIAGTLTASVVITVLLMAIRWLRRDLSKLRDTVFNLAREVSEIRGMLNVLMNLVQNCAHVCGAVASDPKDKKCSENESEHVHD